LGRRADGALLGGERCQILQELRVAVMLARVSLGESLVGGGQVCGEFRAVAAVGAPSGEDDCRYCHRGEDFR
jgi:hypothetical protein